MTKLVTFLYSYSEQTEKKIKKPILLAVIKKKIKYLRINLISKVKDVYIEHFETLPKEMRGCH
jgi:ribosomal protein L18E